MASASDSAILTTSDRIKQLNDIDRDIGRLLHSAGLAVKALTEPSSTTQAEASSQPLSIEQQKEHFRSAASQYFSLLSSIDVRLRRQVYALEEAEIIPAEALKEQQTSLAVPANFAGLVASQNSSSVKPMPPSKGVQIGGGLGTLDVGWLNSRNDNVGKEMEAELWAKAEDFVKALEVKVQDGNTDITAD